MTILDTALGFLPKLEGFSPMPLGIMAPFMAYQSAALAYSFGLNYEYGKRKIKSMSNEQFNELTPIKLNEITSIHHDALLEGFINEVPKTQPIQKLIIDQMVILERLKIEIMPELIAQAIPAILKGIVGLTPIVEATGATKVILDDFQQDLDVNAPAPLAEGTFFTFQGSQYTELTGATFIKQRYSQIIQKNKEMADCKNRAELNNEDPSVKCKAIIDKITVLSQDLTDLMLLFRKIFGYDPKPY